jgi:hypothetical protein
LITASLSYSDGGEGQTKRRWWWVEGTFTSTGTRPGWDKVAATILSVPEIWTMSIVYSLMNAKCRCCLAVHGGNTHLMATTRGRWSLYRVLYNEAKIYMVKKASQQLATKSGIPLPSGRDFP